MAKRKIVLTGACGYLAQRMWDELNARYEVVPLDIGSTTANGSLIAGVQICDLAGTDRSHYRAHFEGADAVVHCG